MELPAARPITIFSRNCFLIPPAFINEDNKTCARSAQRAAAIGAAARSFDIVALQEMWGAQVRAAGSGVGLNFERRRVETSQILMLLL